MANVKRETFDPADFAGLKLRRATALAEIYFVMSHNRALTVTIPARQLSRLYGEIDRKLRRAPELDGRVSKKA